MRLLDPSLAAQLGGLTGISAPLPEIGVLDIAPERVLIVENLQTGLALEPMPGTVAFMAQDYTVEPSAEIPWLRDRPVHYWGDIDTHGLAILDRPRHHLPQAQSLLMDQETLLTHRELWVREPEPAKAELSRLTPAETALYHDLVTNRWGANLRLEQERIDWGWCSERLRRLGCNPAMQGSRSRSPGSQQDGGKETCRYQPLGRDGQC